MTSDPAATYPTPWVAVTHSYSYKGYKGRIERMVSKTRLAAEVCSHFHKRRDLAQTCAERMLAEKPA